MDHLGDLLHDAPAMVQKRKGRRGNQNEKQNKLF